MNDNQVQVDLSWLLQQIAAIQNDTEYLKEGLAHLSQMNVGGKTAPYEPEDVAGRAKAETMEMTVTSNSMVEKMMHPSCRYCSGP